ncbi:hypothetical protein SAMN05660649_00137 [Desulfotomaculum arcticum]|uniref:Uncharacterized protein n=1 Tax=Desulfotruncus arcticus DSM 17038 TaxID=1121424 RepID=A0A1I2MZB7_9FIRM|nr:hypothetical protein [Desulfotruncus arcticus]SFF94656.1 hypothetical protein SAMN05660649_00137 [Desulfotomaculum arcticum] [Desulfotruncus arcticus DSM 17038]
MRKDFLFWGARFERWLLRTVVLCAVMLVAVQWFTKDPVLQAVSRAGIDTNDSIESREPSSAAPSAAELEHLITFQLLEYSTLPMAEVVVNGQKAAAFAERFVTVPVADGDVLEIDTKFYHRPVSVKVLDTYGGVKWPKVDDTFKIEGTVKKLGTVILEDAGKD